MLAFRLAPAVTRPAPANRPGWPDRLASFLRAVLAPGAAVAAQTLPRGRTLWLRRPHGRCVSCEAGTLWLAFDGEPQDIILEAGQTHSCASHARLSIHAMVDSRVRLA